LGYRIVRKISRKINKLGSAGYDLIEKKQLLKLFFLLVIQQNVFGTLCLWSWAGSTRLAPIFFMLNQKLIPVHLKILVALYYSA
jgi:hypothetical protein